MNLALYHNINVHFLAYDFYDTLQDGNLDPAQNTLDEILERDPSASPPAA